MAKINEVTIKRALRLDIIAKEQMGTEQNGCLEALLAANQGLAAGGPYIAPGSTITVPATPTVAPTPTVNPWN